MPQYNSAFEAWFEEWSQTLLSPLVVLQHWTHLFLETKDMVTVHLKLKLGFSKQLNYDDDEILNSSVCSINGRMRYNVFFKTSLPLENHPQPRIPPPSQEC